MAGGVTLPGHMSVISGSAATEERGTTGAPCQRLAAAQNRDGWESEGRNRAVSHPRRQVALHGGLRFNMCFRVLICRVASTSPASNIGRLCSNYRTEAVYDEASVFGQTALFLLTFCIMTAKKKVVRSLVLRKLYAGCCKTNGSFNACEQMRKFFSWLRRDCASTVAFMVWLLLSDSYGFRRDFRYRSSEQNDTKWHERYASGVLIDKLCVSLLAW